LEKWIKEKEKKKKIDRAKSESVYVYRGAGPHLELGRE
jgi:hypothetical protein